MNKSQTKSFRLFGLEIEIDRTLSIGDILRIAVSIIAVFVAVVALMLRIESYQNEQRAVSKEQLEINKEHNSLLEKLFSSRDNKRQMEHFLDSADTFFDVGHFEQAAATYEEATEFITDWKRVDSRILQKARENSDKDPQKASRKYQKFFAPLREK
uniref:Tetratricopeptide repeat-containing protein n=1 Tax=Candidatus Kentrum sp. FM TaxID=2126340 RepID=A0A450SKZ3_9GAMM|nr:MAG: hypothetical protein BECKFM1743A_GA0114220_101195 [Candidatus Kentron sp. FM]VFJ54296.1 MAG: hypothetical protein BECKFM1743C_GA0114222_101375 [Candidatus Kentron sp. FM]VFK10212.1 MAG: hypothetical protein BECKFM1743B_GA0114221_101336 [Candidatus Kentron sp. FM]